MIERLPCFATVTPHEATKSATVEEILKEPILSPPVPTISIAFWRSSLGIGKGIANSRITSAAAAIALTSVYLSSDIPNKNSLILSSLIS